MLARSARRAAVDPVRRAVAAAERRRRDAARRGLVSVLRPHARRSPRARDGALLQSIVRDDRSVLDLLTADYTYVNERIARHYGIAERHRHGVPPRRRCPRRGAACSARAASCVLTSVADRTSPVMRGKWIMEVLLGSPPPPPPPNVPALEADQRDRPAASCCRRASAWKNTARTRRARRATA